MTLSTAPDFLHAWRCLNVQAGKEFQCSQVSLVINTPGSIIGLSYHLVRVQYVYFLIGGGRVLIVVIYLINLRQFIAFHIIPQGQGIMLWEILKNQFLLYECVKVLFGSLLLVTLI